MPQHLCFLGAKRDYIKRIYFYFIFSACGTFKAKHQPLVPWSATAGYNKGMSRVSYGTRALPSEYVIYPGLGTGTRAKTVPKLEIRNAGGNGGLMLFNLFEHKCLSAVRGPPGDVR